MKTFDQFYKWFFLEPSHANMQISNCWNPLRVAPIKKTSEYEKIIIDYDHFAFAEKNQEWEIKYFHWLKHFLLIENPDFPSIFLFDNHNHALPFRYSLAWNFKNSNKSQNKNEITLLHIDQHSDCRENSNYLELDRNKNEVEKVRKFCNQKCNVGNFIPPALQSWIIWNQIQIRSISALKNFKIEKNQIFILDIDLDFCLSWINRNKLDKEVINILKEKWDEISRFALWISIATSPYFLNQDLAIELIETLLNK